MRSTRLPTRRPSLRPTRLAPPRAAPPGPAPTGPPAPVRTATPAPASLARLYVAAPRPQAASAAAAGVLWFRPRGALSALLFLLATAAAAYAAARRLVAANTRSCDACRGFGAQRCPLCRGAGTVAYEGKYIHDGDACPRCLGARHVTCDQCGGLFARRLFAHAREPRVGAGAEMEPPPTAAGEGRGWFGYGAQQTLLD